MNPINLLVVDDNAAEAFLVHYALEDCTRPVNFHFAKDAAEAFQVLGAQTFDLVILDLNLPDLLGFYILRQCDTRIPVVVFSVSADPADAKRALELGAREFVRKPIGLEAYRHAVLKMIETWVLGRGSKTAGV